MKYSGTLQGLNGESFQASFYGTINKFFGKNAIVSGLYKQSRYDTYVNKMMKSRSTFKYSFQEFNYNPKKENEAFTELFYNVMLLMRYTFLTLIIDPSSELSYQALDSQTVIVKDRVKETSSTEFVVLRCPAPVGTGLKEINISASEIPSDRPWVLYGNIIDSFTFILSEIEKNIYKGAVGFSDTGAIEYATVLEYGGIMPNKSKAIVPPRPVIGLILSSRLFKDNYKKIKEYYKSRVPVNTRVYRKLRESLGLRVR